MTNRSLVALSLSFLGCAAFAALIVAANVASAIPMELRVTVTHVDLYVSPTEFADDNPNAPGSVQHPDVDLTMTAQYDSVSDVGTNDFGLPFLFADISLEFTGTGGSWLITNPNMGIFASSVTPGAVAITDLTLFYGDFFVPATTLPAIDFALPYSLQQTTIAPSTSADFPTGTTFVSSNPWLWIIPRTSPADTSAYTIEISVIPEPNTSLLLGFGLIGLGFRVSRRNA